MRPEPTDNAIPQPSQGTSRGKRRTWGLSEPHRWVETTDRKRHAVAADLAYDVGDELTTFCEIQATVDIGDVQHQGIYRECRPCHDHALALLEKRR